MVAYDLHRRSQTGVEETKKKRIRPSKNLDPDSDPLSHHCCQNKAQLSLQMRQNTVQLRSQMRFTEQGRTEFTDADPLSKLCCQNKAQLNSQMRCLVKLWEELEPGLREHGALKYFII